MFIEHQSGLVEKQKISIRGERSKEELHLPPVRVEVNMADRLLHPVPAHQDALSVLFVTVIQRIVQSL